MLRQITEGVKITIIPKNELICSKNEWNFFCIPYAVVHNMIAYLNEYVVFATDEAMIWQNMYLNSYTFLYFKVFFAVCQKTKKDAMSYF